MSIGSDSQSSSQLLSSSLSSLNNHSGKRSSSSEISKTYKHASQLFLTRRLLEAYEALQPVIASPGQTRPDESPAQAPIATATTSQRIKIWSLYVTLLNSIVELGPDEGKQLFGSKEYRDIVRRVQSGDVWQQVVNDGYQGREGSVDAEVVYNLSNLLLGQTPDQKLNQSRLESYFASSSHPDLDLSTQLDHALSNGHHHHHQGPMNGTNTPKDLSSRVKILELFTLHVLPRNGEWDYAKSFIANSDILDEERREAFMQTLQELQEVTEKEDDEVLEEDSDVFEDTETDQPADQPFNESSSSSLEPSSHATGSKHQRTSSEVDYGIERAHPNGGAAHPAGKTEPAAPKTTPPLKGNTSSQMTNIPPQPIATPRSPPPPSAASPSIGRSQLSPPAQTPRRPARKNSKVPSQNNAVMAQARQLFLALTNLARNIAGVLSKNPTAMLRFLLFIFAFVMAFSQRQIRERTRQLMNKGWQKVRQTVGMGVKVSYI